MRRPEGACMHGHPMALVKSCTPRQDATRTGGRQAPRDMHAVDIFDADIATIIDHVRVPN
jgi:hypothetical protein